MTSKPTLIFIPGAWHSKDAWAKVAGIFEKAAYKTVSLQLPSVGANPIVNDLEPDIATVKSAIAAECDQGQEVVIVCHSYGGIPTAAAVQGWSLEDRKAHGLPGGVRHLVYCCAFMISEGDSLFTYFGGDAPWYVFNEDRTVINPNTPETVFYNDLSPEDQAAAIAKLAPHSYAPITVPLKYAGWKHIPTTYIYCLKDNAILIEYQRRMVEETAKGYPIRTETLDASHSPFLSMPEDTAATIKRAVEA